MSTVVVLGTGGTIAGAADAREAAGYGAARVEAATLVAGLRLPAGLVLEAETVARLDSKDMDGATWTRLARRVAHHAGRTEVAGIVVAHGTDTLEETAWLLARTLGEVAVPVVLTGAMRPADAADADGPRNLADAIALAASGGRGLVVAFAGAVFQARGVRKAHTRRIHAFAGREPPRGVACHEAALIGPARLPEGGAAWPWVETVTSGAASTGRAVDALVAAGVQGLVVACTGNGTLHIALGAALGRAVAAGVPVLRATRVADGGIEEPNAGVARFSSAGDLAPPQARVELMLRLLARRAGDA